MINRGTDSEPIYRAAYDPDDQEGHARLLMDLILLILDEREDTELRSLVEEAHDYYSDC